MRKRGKDLSRLQSVVKLLANGEQLSEKHKDHALVGSWRYARDCHIEPDWLLIYTMDKISLRLERTGTHSDLFRKYG
uniref:mRNA interferase YafQ n=2 Tax=unclassified Candidatus Kentrum TaxID=2643149 RepID=A0A451AUT3_9GAMM|nr:MAG: mRNA interferase YafQ [Candidatus Kentron sp. LPFa]VFK61215.1 MAG: mRNA interferase YafQ [Candidatus Kentron sp. UNK]VFK69804.1 MAG: mRNA interferase YafQ [Candidatus Kentron sp. UNK]